MRLNFSPDVLRSAVVPDRTLPASGSSIEKQQLDFAAAVQAGIAYNITDQIIWDNGWQMLWEGNSSPRRHHRLRAKIDRL